MQFKTGVLKMYRIETTDPITGKSLTQLVDMPYVVEDIEDDSLIIYFESECNRDLYLRNPARHHLEHYQELTERH
jgi:hypothetical protein